MKLFQPAPRTAVVDRSSPGRLTVGSTAGTIGQASLKLPTLTLRKARLLTTHCHSPLYIVDQLSCAWIDSGGRSVERPRFGFCLLPRWM